MAGRRSWHRGSGEGPCGGGGYETGGLWRAETGASLFFGVGVGFFAMCSNSCVEVFKKSAHGGKVDPWISNMHQLPKWSAVSNYGLTDAPDALVALVGNATSCLRLGTGACSSSSSPLLSPLCGTPPLAESYTERRSSLLALAWSQMATAGERLRPRRRGAGLPRVVLALALLVAAAASASALNFKIQPKDELCFHEITHKGAWGVARRPGGGVKQRGRAHAGGALVVGCDASGGASQYQSGWACRLVGVRRARGGGGRVAVAGCAPCGATRRRRQATPVPVPPDYRRAGLRPLPESPHGLLRL